MLATFEDYIVYILTYRTFKQFHSKHQAAFFTSYNQDIYKPITHTTTRYFLLPTLHRILVVESHWTTVM